MIHLDRECLFTFLVLIGYRLFFINKQGKQRKIQHGKAFFFHLTRTEGLWTVSIDKDLLRICFYGTAWWVLCCGWFCVNFCCCFLCRAEFKATYTDSSSSFSLARRLSLPFRTPRERLPSIWPNTPNTRTRWFSRTSLCPPTASPAPVSSSPALWLCADHFWDLFCCRLRWLVHWDRNVSPKRVQDESFVLVGGRLDGLEMRKLGAAWKLTSGVHFSGIFSNESGESTEKHIRMTSVSG